MLYDLATEKQKAVLETVYGVKPFSVQTITLERIFIDKLFAAEAYIRNSEVNHRAFEAAKHIYDLAVIADHPKIQLLLADEERVGFSRYAHGKAVGWAQRFHIEFAGGVCTPGVSSAKIFSSE